MKLQCSHGLLTPHTRGGPSSNNVYNAMGSFRWGLFHYKRAPFNRRFDDKDGKMCSLLHNNDLNEHWWRTIEFVELCGKSWNCLEPRKTSICWTVSWFCRLLCTSLHTFCTSSEIYIDVIKEFPTPENIVDIRSWFGLVNQVSHYAQLRDLM